MTKSTRPQRQERLVGWIMRAYPRHVRDRFEAGMHDALARDYEQARARGWRAAAAFVWLSFADALRSRSPKGSVMPARRSSLVLDWRYAVRSLRSTPVVTFVAVLSLGLGIGANTALFSIVNGLILKTLPVRDPASLVMLEGDSWTNPIWEEIRADDRTLFNGALAWSDDRFDLAPGGATDFVPGIFASGSFFDVLGVPPFMGRTLAIADDVRGPASAVVMVSHRFWQQRLGGRADAIGRVVTLNRVPFTVVGVMPPAFFGPVVGRHVDIVIPIGARTVLDGGGDGWLTGRERWWLEIMVRTRPGQSTEQANAALRGIQPRIREATAPERRPGDPNRHLTSPLTLVAAASGESALRNRYQRPLTVVMVVVAALLLIACANIASLLLARASARRHEFAIRVALGASSWRIRRQLLAESLILAVVGAALGLVLAPLGSALLLSQIDASAALDVAMDWRVLAFTAAVASVTAVFFGLAPASTLSRLRANDALVSAGRGVAGDRAFGLRQAIVVAQVALSLVLIVAAGLFLRTFSSLTRAPLGFDPAPLVLANIELPRDGVGPSDRSVRFDAMSAAVAGVPGVRRVASSFVTPVGGGGWNTRITVPGKPALPGRESMAWVNAVSPGWFETYGMRMLAGRDLSPQDRRGGERVTVVTQKFAQRFFGAASPVGQRVKGPHAEPSLIVGVVSDAVYQSARAGTAVTMFVPYAQEDEGWGTTLTIEAAAVPTAELTRAIAAALAGVEARASVTFTPYGERVRLSLARERLVAMLSGFFGGLALLLAGLGLYGVTSYSVQQRRREIGVRMALGSDRRGVVRLVLRRVGWLVGTGVAAGMAISLWTVTFVESLLFGLQPRDPLTIVAASAVLTAVAFLAAALPARRAANLDPTEVLRA